MAININTYYDDYNLISFTTNSIVLKVFKDVEYDTSDRSKIQTSEETIIKINLSDDENEEVILNQLINKDNDIIRRITSYDIEEITNYTGAEVGKVNVESLINRIDRSKITDGHREVLRSIQGANQEKLVIFYKMREYSPVDSEGRSIYTRYLKSDNTLNSELFEKDFLRINEAVHKLHNYKLVHHDIKPSALMFLIQPESEFIKLTDLESSISIDDHKHPVIENLGEDNIRYAYAKRMLKHSKYHQDIESLYDVDKLELILARSRNINIDINDLSLNADCNLVEADYFSIGMTMLDIFMWENPTCNFQTFISILEDRFNDIRRKYVKEARIISEIKNYFKKINDVSLKEDDEEFYNLYLKKFAYNGKFSRIGEIIRKLLNGRSGYNELKRDLNFNNHIPADLISIIKRRIPEIYSRYIATYNKEMLENNLKSLIKNQSYDSVFKNFIHKLRDVLIDFLDIPDARNEFHDLDINNFKSDFLNAIINIESINRRSVAGGNRIDIYSRIINDVDIQLYFAYFVIMERR